MMKKGFQIRLEIRYFCVTPFNYPAPRPSSLFVLSYDITIYCGQIDRSKGKVLKNLEIVRDRDIKIQYLRVTLEYILKLFVVVKLK